MLGDQLGTLTGKIVSKRVLDVTDSPQVEFNVSTMGKLREIEVTELHTYTSMKTLDGIEYGRTNGVIMTKDGSENATFTGHAMGYTNGAGKIKYAGSVFIKSPLKGKISLLNNVFGVFENDVDESGNIVIRLWEWK
jgi:hypothetical protein